MADTTRMMKDGQAYDIPNDKVQGASKLGFTGTLEPKPGAAMRIGSELGLGLATGATGAPESTSGSGNVMDMLKGMFHTATDKPSTGEALGGALVGGPVGLRMLEGIAKQGGQFMKEGWKGQFDLGKAALKGDKEGAIQAGGDIAHGTGGLVGMLVTAGLSESEASKGADSIGKIKGGSYADVVKELEQYRKTVKAKPSKPQKIMADKAHAALTERMDHEWSTLYKKMEAKPSDALSLKKALEPISKIDPEIKKWVETYMPETENSIQMPMWDKVRELSKKMNADLTKGSTDRTIKAEIPQAHKAVEDILKKAADEQGLGQQYQRAYQLNRKVQNIKHHTAFEGSAVKPNSLWQLGGTVLGAISGGHLGVSSEIGGAFMGKSIAGEVGKGVTGAGKYRIPELSVKGEKGAWGELGEKPPKGTEKTVRKGGDIIHYDPPKGGGPASSAPKGGGKPGGGTPSIAEGAVDQATRRGGGQSAQGTRIEALHDQIKNAQAKYENAATTGDKMRAVKDLTKFNEQLLKEYGEIDKTTDERVAAKDAAAKAEDFKTRNKERAGSTMTKEGAALDNQILQKVKKENPKMSMGEQLQLAARLAKEARGQ